MSAGAPWRRLRNIIVHADTEPVGLIMGLYTLSWGLILLLPAKTFANPSYARMESIAPEDVWGVFIVLLGCVILYGVLYGVSVCRVSTSLITALLWTVIGFLTGSAGGWSTTGWIHFFGAALISYAMHYRLLHEFYLARKGGPRAD